MSVRAARLAGFAVLAVASSIVAVFLLLPLAIRGFVRAIEIVMNACVWLAMSLNVGMSLGGMLGVVGRSAAGLVTSRQASLGLIVLVAVGALAAYGLQWLLGLDEIASPGSPQPPSTRAAQGKK